MKVWVDPDLCTGDGICEKIVPEVFVLLDDGLAYVREGETIFARQRGNGEGVDGLALAPPARDDAAVEAAEECPGECIFLEP